MLSKDLETHMNGPMERYANRSDTKIVQSLMRSKFIVVDLSKVGMPIYATERGLEFLNKANNTFDDSGDL